MSREQTPDDALILGMAKKLNLEQLKELYNKTDKSLSHYNKQGFTAFLAAVRLCNHEFIAYVFRQNPTRIQEWVSQFSHAGQSALHILAEKCKDNDSLIRTATLLFANGASIDALSRNDNPVTPLYLATSCQNTKFVSLCLQHGANINIKSKPPYSFTPYALTFAPKQNPAEMSAQAEMRESFLFAACKIGDTLAVEYLLAAGTNVNARDENNDTPLHIAAGCKHLKCVELLLKNSVKPDVNAIDKEGFTPLVFIISRKPHDDENAIAITRLLIQSGADIFHRYKIDNTELICIELMAQACKRDVFEVIDPNIIKQYREKEKGYTLLHLAVLADNQGTHTHSGPIGLFKDILGIDVRSGNGKTPLELVTVNGTALCASLLLYYRANPLAEAPGKKGIHAYAFAKSTDNANPERTEILKLIEEELGIKHEKENVNQPAKPAVPNNLHMRLPTAPACKAVGKTPTLYQPLPKTKDEDIYVSSKLRAGQSAAAAAAASLPPQARTVTAGGPASQRPK